MVSCHSAIRRRRCFTLLQSAAFNVASARIPLLQYRTISLSSGSWARPPPVRLLGSKMLPGMCAMSNSAGSHVDQEEVLVRLLFGSQLITTDH